MRIVGQRSGSGVTQTPRHTEVNQENTTGFEPNNQILAATIERRDALPFELGGDGRRLERTHESGVVDLDTLEATADEVRLERETDRLDLGQLGHQLIVSSTIGIAAGASSPNT
jgi:hypothetical protein